MEHITKNIYFSYHLLNKCVISACFICMSEWKNKGICISFLFQIVTKQYSLVRIMQSNKSINLALIKVILALDKHP